MRTCVGTLLHAYAHAPTLLQPSEHVHANMYQQTRARIQTHSRFVDIADMQLQQLAHSLYPACNLTPNCPSTKHLAQSQVYPSKTAVTSYLAMPTH
eukprot:6200554-Pleurochrysis_carterae.AAC.1